MYQTILCAADHGVAEENVSSFPQTVTTTMVKNYLIHKGAALNAFADFLGASLIVANFGMKEKVNHARLMNFSVRNGTNNITKGAAMTREEAILAIENGKKLAKSAFKNSAKYILPAEMGISNTTSAAAMSAALLNLPPEKVTGRGTNISDEKLAHKINVVKKAIDINNPNVSDALDILSKLGGFEFAAIVGIILEAAEKNVRVILDGLNTTVPALIAFKINSKVRNILVPSHLAGETAHIYLLNELQLTPYIDLDFHLGEACGSSIMAKCMEFDESENYFFSDNSSKIKLKKISVAQKNSAKEDMKKKFAELSMPHHALGALEEIAIILAGEFGTTNISENIAINKKWLESVGITDEKYLINKKRLPHLAEVLTRASLYVLNRMKTFDEAGII